tara:strand:- start:411 stop:1541 length:1131 start_codon:yes stop_codon:yes gene_type:complete
MARRAVIGRLAAVLSLNNKGFNQGIASSKKRLGMLKVGAVAAAGAVVALGTAAVATAVSLGRMVVGTIRSLDASVKLSDRLGLSVTKLMGLQTAARLAGVETNVLGMSLQRLTRRLAEAGTLGKGEAVTALERLGLDAKELMKLSPDRQLQAIARAMGDIQHRGEQVLLSQKLFDSEGVAMLQLLDMGASKLEKVVSMSQKTGQAIGQGGGKAIAAAAENLDMAWVAIEGVKNTLAVAMAPIVEAVAGQFAAWVGNGDKVKKIIGDIAISMAKIVDWAGNLFKRFSDWATLAIKTIRIIRGLSPIGISMHTANAIKTGDFSDPTGIGGDVGDILDILGQTEYQRRGGSNNSNDAERWTRELLREIADNTGNTGMAY